MTNFTITPDGTHTAGAVQTVEFGQAEVHKFQEGCYSAAVDSKAWDTNFVNVWNMAFSKDGKKLAAEGRTSLYDYTIVVNGAPWSESFPCVWQPIFHPKTDAVVAPVRVAGKWTLAQDGKVLWDNSFMQCWNQMYNSDASKLAAIIATKLGKWTMAVDGQPWRTTFSDMVADAVFSPDGRRLAASGKEGSSWTIIVDDVPWNNTYDMVWQPVFSPDSQNIGARVEKDGKYNIAINGKPFNGNCDMAWDPIFSPDSKKVLIRTIEHGNYIRRVVPVTDITG
jgi:hypothetical protein